MRDASPTLFRASLVSRAAMAALLLAAVCALGGCASGGAAGGAFAMAGTGGGPTVAFESIDGPPPQIFERMVDVLDSESKLRNLQVVSREGSASYRVRSYLSAQVSHGRTTIAWVWDVYDRDQQRTLRLSGAGTGRPGRTRPLDRRRRSGVAENRAGRIERPQRHGQWNRAGRAARPRAGQTRPGGGKRGTTRLG